MWGMQQALPPSTKKHVQCAACGVESAVHSPYTQQVADRSKGELALGQLESRDYELFMGAVPDKPLVCCR